MADRTSDFVKMSVLFDTGEVHRPQFHRPLSQDARRSQQIADQLRQQELFLRDLQQLVNKKAVLGEDPSAQIKSLTDLLKKELGQIDRNIQMFQQAIQTQRGKAQQNHQQHFAIVCGSLKSRCAKNLKQFHQALQQHTSALKERTSRRTKFSHGGPSPMVQLNQPMFNRNAPTASPAVQSGDNGKSEAFQPTSGPQEPTMGNSTAPSLAPENGARGNNLPQLRRRTGNLSSNPFMQQSTDTGNGQKAMQQSTYVPRQDAQERYNSARQVESTIVEISGMYTRMANMVSEQGEILSRIDDDMDVAHTNVEAAHGELLKLYNMVSGNRALILKIFLVLLIVIFLFTVVF